jgi:hypothetical protein
MSSAAGRSQFTDRALGAEAQRQSRLAGALHTGQPGDRGFFQALDAGDPERAVNHAVIVLYFLVRPFVKYRMNPLDALRAFVSFCRLLIADAIMDRVIDPRAVSATLESP